MKQIIVSSFLVVFFLSGCAQKKFDVFKNINKFDINYSSNIQSHTSEAIDINKQNQSKKQNSTLKLPNLENNINKRFKIKIRKEINKNSNNKYALSVENIPIPDFIKLIFGQILKYNYNIDSSVEQMKKTVTLKMNKKLNENNFINIVKKILNENGVIFNQENGIYFFKKGQVKIVKKISDYIYYGRNLPSNLSDSAVITVIVPSYYIDLGYIDWMLKRFFLSNNAYMFNYRQEHVLFITDKVKNLRKALNFINMIDVPVLKNKIIRIIPLKYIEVNTFIKRLDTLLPTTGIKIAKNLRTLGILLTPIPELNAVLVVSDKKEWINVVDFWKNKLDTININSKTPQIFIYKPQNRDAKELADLIRKLFKNKNNKNILEVISDEKRNRLIIYTMPKEYKKVYTMLQKLDVIPKQVLIQVTIAEITLKNSLQYGFEWFLRNHMRTASIGTLGNLGIGSGGIVGSVINSGKTFQALLNMLAQKNLINILSSPKILVLNNQSASINVGTQVPVLSSSTSAQSTQTGSTSVTQSVQYRNTGVILNVKPVVHSNGVVELQISQTVSDPQPNNTSSISSPIILNRSINTDVILKSNQALMLGGLIKQSTGRTISKVPFLGDLPFIGNLFKTTSYSKEKTELIIIVKPIIVNSYQEGSDLTNKFRNLIINAQNY